MEIHGNLWALSEASSEHLREKVRYYSRRGLSIILYDMSRPIEVGNRMDISQAKALIDDALTPEEQANFYREQKRQKAVELLGHVANVERLHEELGNAPAGARPQIEDAIAQSEEVVNIVSRAVADFGGKEAALISSIEAVAAEKAEAAKEEETPNPVIVEPGPADEVVADLELGDDAERRR